MDITLKSKDLLFDLLFVYVFLYFRTLYLQVRLYNHQIQQALMHLHSVKECRPLQVDHEKMSPRKRRN